MRADELKVLARNGADDDERETLGVGGTGGGGFDGVGEGLEDGFRGFEGFGDGVGEEKFSGCEDTVVANERLWKE